MKKLIFALVATFASNTYAETHGGVIKANERFKSAYEFAMGSDYAGLDRLGAVQRIKECMDEGTLYKVTYESMGFNGIISQTSSMKVKVVGDPWDLDSPIQATQVSGCK